MIIYAGDTKVVPGELDLALDNLSSFVKISTDNNTLSYGWIVR